MYSKCIYFLWIMLFRVISTMLGLPMRGNKFFRTFQTVSPTILDTVASTKDIISISPGGYKGFYVLGICQFIKEHYPLENYIFSGASAGSWNALAMCFTGNFFEFQMNVIDHPLQHYKTIHEMEYHIIDKIMRYYTKDDFDLTRLYIGVTAIEKCQPKSIIYSNFTSLRDALECCVASSHIPFVTGGALNTYKNVISFDGGFCQYPYINHKPPVLHITPNLWSETKANQTKMSIADYTTLFSKNKYNFRDMMKQGYDDSAKNKARLDSIFLPKN